MQTTYWCTNDQLSLVLCVNNMQLLQCDVHLQLVSKPDCWPTQTSGVTATICLMVGYRIEDWEGNVSRTQWMYCKYPLRKTAITLVNLKVPLVYNFTDSGLLSSFTRYQFTSMGILKHPERKLDQILAYSLAYCPESWMGRWRAKR